MALASSPALQVQRHDPVWWWNMDLDRVKTLIDAMAASDLNEMEFSENGWSLRLVRRVQPDGVVRVPVKVAPSGRPSTRPEADVAPKREADVAAPLFGIVYLQPARRPPLGSRDSQSRVRPRARHQDRQVGPHRDRGHTERPPPSSPAERPGDHKETLSHQS